MKIPLKYISLLVVIFIITFNSGCILKPFLISGPSKKIKTDTSITITRSHYYISFRRFTMIGLRIKTKTSTSNNVLTSKIITRITPAFMAEGHKRVFVKKKVFSTTGKLQEIRYSVVQHKGAEIDHDKSYEKTISFDAKGHKIK